MQRRAFIVAIERYDQIKGSLDPVLPGTHAGALAFRDWLISEQGVAAEDVFFCAEDPGLPGRTAGAERREIKQELLRLHGEGQDSTDELYFYFSGHGVCFKDVDGSLPADLLVCADFVALDESGDACIELPRLQAWLRNSMGPGEHFFFVDSCRTFVNDEDIRPAELGITDRPGGGVPDHYTLYSTAEGAIALAQSGFPQALIDGLNGTGRAKMWRDDGSMAVVFDPLHEYLSGRLSSEIDKRVAATGPGVIREIQPTPEFTCEIEVVDAAPTDRFQLKVSNLRKQPIGAPQDFTGPTWRLKTVPDDYLLEVVADGAPLTPLDPLPVDLYQDAKIRFQMEHRPVVSGGGGVNVTAPEGGNVRILNAMRTVIASASDHLEEALAEGVYTVDVVDDRDLPVAPRRVEVGRDEAKHVDFSAFQSSPLRDAMLEAIPGDHRRGSVDFSETLGPLPDQGLDMWLGIIGASRIVGRHPHEFEKLGGLPLSAFDDLPAPRSGVYVLAGFDDPRTAFGATLSSGGAQRLQRKRLPTSFPGLYELPVRDLVPGCRLLTFQVGRLRPISIPVCALAGRVTLVTITLDEHGGARVQQFMLPVGRLLDTAPGLMLPHNPLRTIRSLVELHRRFEASRTFLDDLEKRELDGLLYGKWFEPISAMLGAYELVRRGRADDRLLFQAVRNLRSFFPELPDTEAIAKMAGYEDARRPAFPPLVLEGLSALDLLDGDLPLPAEALDWRGPWTRWRGRRDERRRRR